MKQHKKRGQAQCLGLLFLAFLVGCAGADAPQAEVHSTVAEALLPIRDNWREILTDGEALTYGITWSGILPVGRVTYTYAMRSTLDGDLIRLEGITEPALRVDAFLEASGRIRTWVDPETWTPLTTEWHTAEDVPLVRSIYFDQGSGEQVATVRTDERASLYRTKPGRVLDPILSVYLARLVAMEPGDSKIALVHVGHEIQQMDLRCVKRTQLRHDKQPEPCLLMTLKTRSLNSDGTVDEDAELQGDLKIWVAESPRRPVLRISGSIPFGSLVLRLGDHHIPESDTELPLPAESEVPGS